MDRIESLFGPAGIKVELVIVVGRVRSRRSGEVHVRVRATDEGERTESRPKEEEEVRAGLLESIEDGVVEVEKDRTLID